MDNIQIIQMLEEEGVELTDDINQAIYILSDGRLISGMFDCGIRGVDHRIIELLFEDVDRDSENFWDEVVNRANLVMYVPETKTILLKENQNITNKQLEMINNLKRQNHIVENF
ncbi:TPA: hypothetical protein PZR02_002702 [Staphylococcus aureus]|nr:hypothetical protein [Staphylococcus aureus]HDM3615677.1 hypothetical protein [Staphylococcus aureus]HDM4012999.1 hypothetical protein [Staphylococcus aureus]